MKSFLKRIILFLGVLAVGIILVFYLADGKSDPFYLRFTSKKQSSLILGTSKAAQAVQPSIINRVLNRDDIYNYAFTVAHSPYGPIYLNSVKKKIDTTKRSGIFIITVDPYSVSSRREDPNEISNFREKNLALGQIEKVNSSPNFEYLLFHYPLKYIYLITKKLEYVSNEKLHDDGWYEVNISMNERDQRDRVRRKVESYEKKLKEDRFSEKRFESLIETIEFLKRHGEVFLVRLPVSKPFLEMENKLSPTFNKRISELSHEFEAPYLNLNNNPADFNYTDGNHLYKDSGREVSYLIAEWIKNQKMK